MNALQIMAVICLLSTYPKISHGKSFGSLCSPGFLQQNTIRFSDSHCQFSANVTLNHRRSSFYFTIDGSALNEDLLSLKNGNRELLRLKMFGSKNRVISEYYTGLKNSCSLQDLCNEDTNRSFMNSSHITILVQFLDKETILKCNKGKRRCILEDHIVLINTVLGLCLLPQRKGKGDTYHHAKSKISNLCFNEISIVKTESEKSTKVSVINKQNSTNKTVGLKHKTHFKNLSKLSNFNVIILVATTMLFVFTMFGIIYWQKHRHQTRSSTIEQINDQQSYSEISETV